MTILETKIILDTLWWVGGWLGHKGERVDLGERGNVCVIGVKLPVNQQNYYTKK